MFRLTIGCIGLLGLGLAVPAYSDQAQSPPTQAQSDGTTTSPDRRAETATPPNGVIHPAPDSSHDTTVTPPNVDPGMAIRPPGTPGGDPKVIPK